MAGAAGAVNGGWLFGLSLFNSILVLALCVLIPVLAYKVYVAKSQLRRGFSKRAASRPRFVEEVHYPYGVEELQGKRDYMEDRHVEAGNLGGNTATSFYAVFDGHGGSQASEFCVEAMVPNLVNSPHFPSNPHQALTHAFMSTDRQFMEIAERKFYDDGTTACAALIIKNRLFVANAGDTRAVVVQRQGKVVAMSLDHKPHRMDEKDRIRKLGGSVFLVGVWRVEGILAVSRAIGDRVIKRYVTAEPEIRERFIAPGDRYLVIASDGLWDVMSNEEVGDMIYKISSPQRAAAVLVECAYSRGSADNITALVVDLLHPKSTASSTRPNGVASSTSLHARGKLTHREPHNGSGGGNSAGAGAGAAGAVGGGGSGSATRGSGGGLLPTLSSKLKAGLQARNIKSA